MLVAEAVGRALVALGADTVFGVVGSGNFHATNAMVAAGARYVAARHEGGAVMMADGYARVSGRLGVLSVHQGPGLTNATTGITEAAKSRTPLVVLAADTGAAAVRSNFRIDQGGLADRGRRGGRAGALGRLRGRRHGPGGPDRGRASAAPWCSTCRWTCRPCRCREPGRRWRRCVPLPAPRPAAAAVAELAAILDRAAAAGVPGRPRAPGTAGAGRRRAGRARAARCWRPRRWPRGCSRGDPWSLDVSGGFASPLAAELIGGADVIVGLGLLADMWTTRHGKLIGPQATVVQVDLDPDAIGANRPIDLGVLGDVAATAAGRRRARSSRRRGYRDDDLRDRIAARGPLAGRVLCGRARTAGGRIDPRTLSIALDDLLPADRVVAVDSGNFMGYPSMYLSVPDEQGFCFTQAFQSIGLGLGHRDRRRAGPAGPAAGGRARRRRRADGGQRAGDRGAAGAAAGRGRLRRPRLRRRGAPLRPGRLSSSETVRFPDTDIAAIGRGFGCAGVTVRGAGRPRAGASTGWPARATRRCVIDAKVTADTRLLVAGGGLPRPLTPASAGQGGGERDRLGERRRRGWTRRPRRAARRCVPVSMPRLSAWPRVSCTHGRLPPASSSARTSKPIRCSRTTVLRTAPSAGSVKMSMSCGRTSRPSSRVTGPRKLHHEVVRRLVVQLGRASRPARSGRR